MNNFNLRDLRAAAGAPTNGSGAGYSYHQESKPSQGSGGNMFGGRKSVFERGFNMDSIFRMTDINADVQSHLVKVYTALCMTLLAATLGAYVHIQTNIGGMLTGIATMGVMMLLRQTPQNEHQKRMGLLAAFGFFKGASIGPIIDHAMRVDPMIIFTAFLGTTMIFACFTAAALVAKRRSYMYLGGVLGSMMSFMFLTSLINMFFHSSGMNMLHLYMGLFIFVGYVLFDTQMIVEKAANGDKDHVWHAIELFIDFVEIFYRLVMILLRNQQNKGRSKEDDRRRRR